MRAQPTIHNNKSNNRNISYPLFLMVYYHTTNIYWHWDHFYDCKWSTTSHQQWRQRQIRVRLTMLVWNQNLSKHDCLFDIDTITQFRFHQVLNDQPFDISWRQQDCVFQKTCKNLSCQRSSEVATSLLSSQKLSFLHSPIFSKIIVDSLPLSP